MQQNKYLLSPWCDFIYIHLHYFNIMCQAAGAAPLRFLFIQNMIYGHIDACISTLSRYDDRMQADRQTDFRSPRHVGGKCKTTCQFLNTCMTDAPAKNGTESASGVHTQVPRHGGELKSDSRSAMSIAAYQNIISRFRCRASSARVSPESSHTVARQNHRQHACSMPHHIIISGLASNMLRIFVDARGT